MPHIPARTWISCARLAQDSVTLFAHLPGSIDCIVGISRSGLIPGSIIASMFHRPLWIASSRAPDRIVPCHVGWRLASDNPTASFPDPAEVLVVDDTTSSGKSLANAVQSVRNQWPNAKVYTAVIYASPSMIGKVDFVVASYSSPHYYEWNLLNGIHSDPAYGAVATDLDGILCPEVPRGSDDDGPKYLEYISNAPALQRPNRRPLRAIVTARLEKYRPVTEEWLRQSGICWEQLIMGPWATIAERNAVGTRGVARWKAGHYRNLGCKLFVESDANQATVIRKASGKEVLCPPSASIACGSKLQYFDPAPFAVYPEIAKANLIYHVFPSMADDACWRRCIGELREHWGVFTGRKILSVAQGDGCRPLEEVQAELGKPDAEWLTVPNDPVACEFASFPALLAAVESRSPSEATFYGHTKGVATTIHKEGAENWRRGLVRALLGNASGAMENLRYYAAVGGCKMLRGNRPRRYPSGLPWPDWMFAGTMFWFRNDAVFATGNWKNIPKDRYASEAWIGRTLASELAYSLYQPWPEEGSGDVWPYDPKWHIDK